MNREQISYYYLCETPLVGGQGGGWGRGGEESRLSGYLTDTLITTKADAILKANWPSH